MEAEMKKGIGGWLLVFVIWLLLRASFDVVLVVLTAIAGKYMNPAGGKWLAVNGMLGILFLIAAAFLLKKNAAGVRLAYIVLGAHIVFSPVMLSSVFITDARQSLFILSTFLQDSFWILYLWQSKRVRNTYFPAEVSGEAQAASASSSRAA